MEFETAKRFFSVNPGSRLHTIKVILNGQRRDQTSALPDKVLHDREKLLRHFACSCDAVYKVCHPVLTVAPLVKGKLRSDLNPLFCHCYLVQERCHMPVIPDIVRASSVYGN